MNTLGGRRAASSFDVTPSLPLAGATEERPPSSAEEEFSRNCGDGAGWDEDEAVELMEATNAPERDDALRYAARPAALKTRKRKNVANAVARTRKAKVGASERRRVLL
mmetsp:Transcript_46350/g.140392  ORF Transcript_46350/g.140392 Transcript_46350/m.140392 type:complete len:108 (+) Transcript_46350:1445-1768(+)